MAYELWDFAAPALPPRSRLYSLPPIGIGTAHVESLTSYVMRLAEAHAVSPGTLMRQEILPNLCMNPKPVSCAVLHSLNGFGPRSMQWIKILESLTARNDLYALTLLPWRSILASDGLLRRRHRAWCPRCYLERRIRGQVIYDSLLWMLAQVTICPWHETSLEEFCPRCEKHSLPLSGRGHPGFCSYCNAWLGSNFPVPLPAGSGREMESRLQVAREIGALLSWSTTTTRNQPDRSHLRSNIQRAIADLADGNRLLLCRIAKISDRALTDWVSGRNRPSLPLLITVAHNLRMPLSRLLFEDISTADELWIQARKIVQAEHAKLTMRREILRRQPDYPMTRRSLWALPAHERKAAKAEVKASMEAALEMNVPRSVRDIFRSLGYRQCVMGRYWFPELYAAIQSKRKQRSDPYKQELHRALTETPPPTVTEVAQRLGVSLAILRGACPELYSRLFLRYPDRRHFQIARTEEALKKSFEEAPASFTQLAARLHRNAARLRMTHPDIYAPLRQRYIAHQALERQQVDLIYRKEVQQAVEQITTANEYPSLHRVLSLISKKNPSLMSFHLTHRALKQVRQELAETATTIAALELQNVRPYPDR